MTKKVPKSNQADDLRRRAEKRITDSMDDIGEMSAPEIQKLVHEFHVHQIELEMQNEALQRSQMETAESQHKYTDLYDFAPIGYFTLDKKGRIMEANVTGASLLGAEKRSLIKQPFQRFIVHGYFSIFQSHLQKAHETQSKQICKLKLTGKDGGLFDALMDTIAVIDGEGKFDQYRSSVTDITEITRAEELRRSEERYRSIFQNNHATMLLIDPETAEIVDANPAACRYYGHTLAQLKGMKITDINTLTREQVFQEMELAKIERRNQFMCSHRLANGEVRPVEVFSGPIELDGRHLLYSIVHDITERKQAELREKVAREVLELLNRPEGSTDTVRDILQLIKNRTGFEAVGIRLREGDDFPYYETNGFSEDFIQAERYLCARDEEGKIIRDGQGKPVLECMCGNILCNRTDPTLSFFTEGGSFWSNCTTELLASTTEKDRQARTRNRCNGEGYESVGLIPLRSGDEIIGLLQLNDRRHNQFTPEMIRFFEGLGASIGIALSRKQADEALRESEEKFRTIFENSSSAMAIISRDTTISMVNREYCKIGLFEEKDVIGKSWTAQIPPGDRERLKEYNRQRLIDPKSAPDHYEFTFYRKDGNIRHSLMSVAIIPTSQNIVCSFVDITDRKQAEADKEKLEVQNRQIQKAESLGRMAGAIAHTFNNQLGVVIGNLELALIELSQGARPHANITAAMSASNKAAEVSGLMLTYLGQSFDKREPLALSDACRWSLPMLRAVMPEDVVLETDLPSPGPAISTNANYIHQILSNLMTNAWESVGEEGGSIHLGVKTVSPADIPAVHRFPLDWQPQDNAYACLEVADEGCGIEDKDIEKLFDPFFSSKFTGRGMGLAVVMGIVRTYKGVVTVESEPGRGSTFRVFLPVSGEEVLRQPEKA